MKYLMLAGTLAALLLLPFVIANTPNAYANIFLIDNFTADLAGMECDMTVSNPLFPVFPYAKQAGLGATVIDGIRECQIILLIANSPDSGSSTVVEADQMYRHMSGPGVSVMSFLQYDGVSDAVVGPGNPRTLNLNLLNSDNLRIQYSFADFEVNVTATLIDGGGDSASIKKFLDAGTFSIKNLNFPLGDFVTENAALSLGDIDEIHINFTNTVVATDYTLEKIDITMQMVGGEMFPTDTTALLLAGAELNAIWILPAIAAIGIGAFVVTRKRK